MDCEVSDDVILKIVGLSMAFITGPKRSPIQSKTIKGYNDVSTDKLNLCL